MKKQPPVLSSTDRALLESIGWDKAKTGCHFQDIRFLRKAKRALSWALHELRLDSGKGERQATDGIKASDSS